MRYFEWDGEITGVDFREDNFAGKWWMVECSPVIGWDESIVGTYFPRRLGLPPGNPSFNFGLALNGWPIFSPKLTEFMESNNPGVVQFLPFRLRIRKPVEELRGYCVGQILRLVDCLDRKLTQVRNNWKPINKGGDFGIRWPFTLRTDLIGDEELFRIKGHSVCIVIREDLREAMEEAGFTGQKFEEIQTS